MSFVGELKRRNVFRVAGLYAVVSWLLVQIAASLEEAVGLPVWFDGFVVSLLAIGFPIALVIAWAFELTPGGVKPTGSSDAQIDTRSKLAQQTKPHPNQGPAEHQPAGFVGFLGELKRRNVLRVAGVYAVVAWLLVQIGSSLELAVGLPEWFDGLVMTLLGIGFPIALVFAWAYEVTSDGIKPTSTIDTNEDIAAYTGGKLTVVLLATLLIFAGAMLLLKFLGTAQQPELVPDIASTRASVAVLPFADLSPEGDQEYFTDGISEELLNVLARVNGMKVAGRTSSFAFKGRNIDLREIGRVLDVEHILEGSVRSQGNRIRVTAQLVQVSDGFHIWSETYDGDLSDIFAVQDDIANRILMAMKTQLNIEGAITVTPVQRADAMAYTLFLEARDLFRSRNSLELRRALELLNEAIAIDPSYAPAYASRAKAFVLLSEDNVGTLPTESSSKQAELDIKQALNLDPELADAYAVRGLINVRPGRYEEAIPDLRRAVELNPNSLDARTWLAKALGASGRARDTADELRVLIEIDPLYAPAVGSTIELLEEAGDKTTARRIAERYIAGTPDENEKIIYRSRLLKLDGKLAESMKMLETLPEALLQSTYRFSLQQDYSALGVNNEYTGAAQAPPSLKPFMLLNESNFEGAINLARSANDSPDLAVQAVYIAILCALGQDREAVDYLNRELPELDFKDFPPIIIYIAPALQRLGEQDRYDQAMQVMRDGIAKKRAAGSPGIEIDGASYWAVSGDTGKALDLLEMGIAKEQEMPVWFFLERAFGSLRQDPRFISLVEANLEKVNEERVILGYAPLTMAFYHRYNRMCDESPYCDLRNLGGEFR